MSIITEMIPVEMSVHFDKIENKGYTFHVTMHGRNGTRIMLDGDSITDPDLLHIVTAIACDPLASRLNISLALSTEQCIERALKLRQTNKETAIWLLKQAVSQLES